MPIMTVGTGRALFYSGSYAQKVLGYGPIAYWPLDESAGAVARCLVNPAQNGTAVGVTWANDATGLFGTAAPFFDGVNDYVNVQTAALAAAFSGAEGSIAHWVRATDWDINGVSGVYFVNAANRIFIQHYVGGATGVSWNYIAGGVALNRGILRATIDAQDGNWVHLAGTWSAANNRTRFYMNGIQVGADIAGVGVWAGNPVTSVIGAYSIAPALPLLGWIAHPGLWATELGAPAIADLAAGV